MAFTLRQEAISTRINNGSSMVKKLEKALQTTAGKATINYGSHLVQHQWKPSRKWVIIPAVRATIRQMHLIAIGRLRLLLPIKQMIVFALREINHGAGYSTPGMTEMYHHWLMASNVYREGD